MRMDRSVAQLKEFGIWEKVVERLSQNFNMSFVATLPDDCVLSIDADILVECLEVAINKQQLEIDTLKDERWNHCE